MVESKKNKILLFAGAGLILVAGTFILTKLPLQIGLAEVPTEKNLTDAEWAEDVKKENLDIKSSGVLREMLASHKEKMVQEEVFLLKFKECPECIRYELRQFFIETYGMTGRELEVEVEKTFNERYLNEKEGHDSLRLSVERMEKELELRQEGFVIVEGEKPTDGFEESKIRKIND